MHTRIFYSSTIPTLEDSMKDPGLSLGQEEKLRPYSKPPWGHMDSQVTEIMKNLGFIQESLTGRKHNNIMGTCLIRHTRKTKMKAAPSGEGPAPPLTPTSVFLHPRRFRHQGRRPNTLPGRLPCLEARTAPPSLPPEWCAPPPRPPPQQHQQQQPTSTLGDLRWDPQWVAGGGSSVSSSESQVVGRPLTSSLSEAQESSQCDFLNRGRPRPSHKASQSSSCTPCIAMPDVGVLSAGRRARG